MVFKHGNRWISGHRGKEGPLDLPSGGIGGVQDTPLRMASFFGQIQLAAPTSTRDVPLAELRPQPH